MTNPYFYIIEHQPSKRKYAGARWGKNCHPNELLQDCGYYTSSPTVHSLIEEDGLNSFSIVELIEMDDPYKYETEFLTKNDCANSLLWLNHHNNNGRPPPFGSLAFKNLMLTRYGGTHNTLIPTVKAKMIETTKKNMDYGERKIRALKIAENRRKNGTTTKGIKRDWLSEETRMAYAENGRTKVITEAGRASLSRHATERLLRDNPMSNKESREKVGLSKIGRRMFINEATNERKYFVPGTELNGFVRAKKS